VNGRDYAGALTTRILVPLGMAHTGFDNVVGMLPGHAYGQETAHWHFSALAGAAGLHSTLNDLLAFVRANLQPEGSSLRGALLLARQPQAAAPAGGLGLGWTVRDISVDQQTWPLIWRASETGGFSVFVGFRTDRQQGLVLLANSATELAPIGVAWLSGDAPPATPSPPFSPQPARVALYPGLYRLASDTEVTIRSTPRGLAAQLRGQPIWPLHPVAEDVYVTNGGAVGVTFIRDIDQISGLVLQQNGTYISAQRLSDRAPRLPREPIAIARSALAAYAGDFQVDPGVQLRVSTTADGLMVQYTGSAPMAMRAIGPDRFADVDGINQLFYHRDEHGRIDRISADLAGGERMAHPVHWQAPALPAYTAPTP
jgi:CubicO group peptidase (beta-lactamase class C family)